MSFFLAVSLDIIILYRVCLFFKCHIRLVVLIHFDMLHHRGIFPSKHENFPIISERWSSSPHCLGFVAVCLHSVRQRGDKLHKKWPTGDRFFVIGNKREWSAITNHTPFHGNGPIMIGGRLISNFITLALVNCTIGPSSDTTWFPTWMKGIFPMERTNIRNVGLEWQDACGGCTDQTVTCTQRCICRPPELADHTSGDRPACEKAEKSKLLPWLGKGKARAAQHVENNEGFCNISVFNVGNVHYWERFFNSTAHCVLVKTGVHWLVFWSTTIFKKLHLVQYHFISFSSKPIVFWKVAKYKIAKLATVTTVTVTTIAFCFAVKGFFGSSGLWLGCIARIYKCRGFTEIVLKMSAEKNPEIKLLPEQKETRRGLTAGSDGLQQRNALTLGDIQAKCFCRSSNLPFSGWYKVAFSGQGSAAVDQKQADFSSSHQL